MYNIPILEGETEKQLHQTTVQIQCSYDTNEN